MLDLILLEDSSVLRVRLPQELVDNINEHIPRSPLILCGNTKLLTDSTARVVMIERLDKQVEQLMAAVDEDQKDCWRILLDPERHWTTKPSLYGQGSMEEARLKLQYVYDAWAELPGAIDVIRAKVEGTGR